MKNSKEYQRLENDSFPNHFTYTRKDLCVTRPFTWRIFRID